LSTQILVSQISILVVTVIVGFVLFASAERDHLDREYQSRALAIANTVAGIPLIREALEYGDSGNAIQSTAERIRISANALYVVVIDLDRVRHSHTNPALIGQRVEEPLIALDGQDHTGVDNGSLGPSANGKAPVYGPSGAIVGEVSVGLAEKEVTEALSRERPTFAVYFGIALLVGAIASYVLAWRIKRTTFGLELHEFATLLQEREAMLHGIREGVVAFDVDGRITVINDEARRLLELGGESLGRRLVDVLPQGRLLDVLSGQSAGPDQIVLTDNLCLVVNRMPVQLRGRELGAVVTVRDRTELVGVLRELDNVRSLSDALRAQQHEFANQMHAVAGLIELGDPSEALALIAQSQANTAGRNEAVGERIGSPLIAALVVAKMTVAAERGVELALSEDSWLDERPAHPQSLLTIVGNLLDNAIDAAAGGATPSHVRLHIGQDDAGTAIEVIDSGPGVPVELAGTVFYDGYSTKPATGTVRRGLGLALVHRVIARLGGTIDVGIPPGGSFRVWLPDVFPTTIGGARGLADVVACEEEGRSDLVGLALPDAP
jgi:two-component system CitB family sensor kinase